MNTFGATIRRMRKEKKLSVRKLAERSGVSHPYLSQIENGKNNASPTIIMKLAKGLECHYWLLLAEAGYEMDSRDKRIKELNKHNEALILENLKLKSKKIVNHMNIQQEWNMYHCTLCEVEFSINRDTDFGEASCPKCESGEATYFLQKEWIGRNNELF